MQAPTLDPPPSQKTSRKQPHQTQEPANNAPIPLNQLQQTTPNSPILNLKTPILLPMSNPPIRPPLHAFPSFSTPHINSRNDLLNPQRRAEHAQLSETAMLRIRDSETFSPVRGSSLRRQVFDGICRLPRCRVENVGHVGGFETRRGRFVVPA